MVFLYPPLKVQCRYIVAQNSSDAVSHGRGSLCSRRNCTYLRYLDFNCAAGSRDKKSAHLVPRFAARQAPVPKGVKLAKVRQARISPTERYWRLGGINKYNATLYRLCLLCNWILGHAFAFIPVDHWTAFNVVT